MAFIRKVSPEEYARFLQAFRQTSGDYKLAASLLNMDQRTVKKAFEEGWPKAGLKAVKDIDQYDEVALKLPFVPPLVAPSTGDKPLNTPGVSQPESGADSASLSEQGSKVVAVPRQNQNSPALTEVDKALSLLDDARAAAIRKDLEILETIRHNTQGVQVISMQLLATVQKTLPNFSKLIEEDSESMSRENVLRIPALLEKLTKILGDGAKAFSVYREGMDALGQVGQHGKQPQHPTGGPVTYEHGEGGETTVTEVMSVIKRTTHKRRAGGYAGEENAEHRVVIDVKPIPPQLIDGGKVVANEPPAAPISAEPLE